MRGLWEEEAFGNLKLRRENEEEEGEEIEVETYWSEEWEAQMRKCVKRFCLALLILIL